MPLYSLTHLTSLFLLYRNNDFRFAGEHNNQTRCPFAAHIRKTLPRADLEDLNPPISLESRRIMRRGIQFGPEVTSFEKFEGRTLHGRGLLFACYQSSIVNGFQFIQKSMSTSLLCVWRSTPTDYRA
jgi:deferrochelatase/peroxidase EfeB